MSGERDPRRRLSRQIADFAKLQWRLWHGHLQAAVPILGILIGASAGLGARHVEAWLAPHLAAPQQAISHATTLLGAAKAPP